jgi:hypothetical protein
MNIRIINNRFLLALHILGSSCGGADSKFDVGSTFGLSKKGGMRGETTVDPPTEEGDIVRLWCDWY